jgi:hypothetical protein
MCLMQVETRVWGLKGYLLGLSSLQITKVCKQITLNEKYVQKTHRSTWDCTKWHRWGKWMDDLFPTLVFNFSKYEYDNWYQ